jgi:hypothetical protein
MEPVAPHRMVAAGFAVALLNTMAMTVLFGSQTGFVAFALDWSIAGLFHLPPAVYLPLGAVPVALALVATAAVAKRAWTFERQAGG